MHLTSMGWPTREGEKKRQRDRIRVNKVVVSNVDGHLYIVSYESGRICDTCHADSVRIVMQQERKEAEYWERMSEKEGRANLDAELRVKNYVLSELRLSVLTLGLLQDIEKHFDDVKKEEGQATIELPFLKTPGAADSPIEV